MKEKKGLMLFIIITLLICISFNLPAQITIGATSRPNDGAILQLKQNENTENNSTKGLAMPRVKLTDTDNLYPMFAIAGSSLANHLYDSPALKAAEDEKHTGLIVYNIDELILDKGLYIWDGKQWRKLGGDGSNSHNEGRIKLSLSTKRLAVTQDYTLTATINSSEIQTIVWSSSDESIATVDQNGKIIAKTIGNANIKATYGDGSHYAECRVEIYPQTSHSYRYRLTLKDKGDHSGHSIGNPSLFLSQRAINRRTKQNIPIDQSDLPISNGYLRQIESMGGIIVAKSKWLNTITVHCSEEFMNKDFEDLPFITNSELVWYGNKNARNLTESSTSSQLTKRKEERTKTPSAPYHARTNMSKSSTDYGRADINISMNKGKILHDNGFKGEGIAIAVIDDGFGNVDQMEHFNNVNIAGAKSFVYKQPNVYDPGNWHGPEVLSCLAANTSLKNGYVGTAPNAEYWLLRSEDNTSDWPLEEDYWVTAAEYADSVGVDLINTSVGYGKAFTDYTLNYIHDNTDGKTIFMSRGANVAASKGILVICSAGNDGTTTKRWVDTPGEALDVLCVGGVNSNGTLWQGTSHGSTAARIMRPDILAMGGNVPVMDVYSQENWYSGTSFSAPILCGLAACLWQAYPTLTSKELLDVIKESGKERFAPIPASWDNSPSNPTDPEELAKLKKLGVADMEKAIDIIEQKYIKGYIELDKDSIAVEIGQQIRITPVFSNETVSKKNFTWSTDKTGIVSFETNDDKSVSITALNKGSVSVKIEATDKSISASCLITITQDGNRIIRVLAIGNSFTDNSVQEHIYNLAVADSQKVIIARLTRGGATLQMHVDNANANTTAYQYWKIDQGGNVTNSGAKTIADAIGEEEWDYVSFQQQSWLAGQYDSYKEYIPKLVEYTKSKSINTETKYTILQTWAFAPDDYTYDDFSYYDNNQLTMHAAIVDAVDRSSNLVSPKMGAIPAGTAIQNGRTSIIGDQFCAYDGFHLNLTGCFTAACTLYEEVTGRNVVNNTYKPSGISNKHIEIIKNAAHMAVAKPKEVTEMLGFQE